MLCAVVGVFVERAVGRGQWGWGRDGLRRARALHVAVVGITVHNIHMLCTHKMDCMHNMHIMHIMDMHRVCIWIIL